MDLSIHISVCMSISCVTRIVQTLLTLGLGQLM